MKRSHPGTCTLWYSLTREEIKELEDLDLTLLRKIFKVPFSTPSEAYYLELGIDRLRQ
jgi:hypothetical protein